MHSNESVQASEAELILTGGRVWTGAAPAASGGQETGDKPASPDPQETGPAAPTALAVAGGRILAVGTDADIRALAGPDTRRIELGGRRVIPGFMDNHTHFLRGGLERTEVQLRDATSPDEFARRIRDFAATRRGRWITGGQWDHEMWGGELPHRDWIDPDTPETPVFVRRHDQHMGLANGRALELAGIGTGTADPPGGRILREEDGRPTGVLKDAAMDLVRAKIPAPTEAQWDEALETACSLALERGLTHVTDMGTDHGWAGLDTYRRAHGAGRLPLKVYAAVPIAEWPRMAELVDREGRGDGRLRWGAVKGFVDGSLGAGTAWFHEPYADDPGNVGLQVCDPDELRERIRDADAAGLHVIVHAIGDRAADWLLDAYAAAREANGPRDRRFRLEHAQHLRPETMPRFAAEGVIASMQPIHLVDDGPWAERRIGPERARTTYACRDLLDAGATVTFGSDWTVAPLDPLQGIHAAVTRQTAGGAHCGGWVPEQRIGVAEALIAYTAANAYASYREDQLGKLCPGYETDLVVLSGDILTTEAAAMDEIRVDLTVVEGEVAYRSSSF